jgi:drug/metabolite transporter (DMT)-like permease
VILQWALVMVIVVTTTIGDLLQSIEMKQHGEVHDLGANTLRGFVKRPLLLWAILCMAISFFSFMVLLSVADLSFAVPATAGSYVIETILARILLKEQITSFRWAGVMLVTAGVALLAA